MHFPHLRPVPQQRRVIDRFLGLDRRAAIPEGAFIRCSPSAPGGGCCGRSRAPAECSPRTPWSPWRTAPSV